jgi:hypothetical protein
LAKVEVKSKASPKKDNQKPILSKEEVDKLRKDDEEEK